MIAVMSNNWLVSLMAITFNFSTGEIGWSSSTGATGPGAGVDNLLLTNGDNFLLTSGAEDVLLLT